MVIRFCRGWLGLSKTSVSCLSVLLAQANGSDRQNKEVLGPALADVSRLCDRVKAMGKALNDLSQSLERKVNTLKAELHPSFLHHGIRSVPDETLEQIFSILVHETGDKPRLDPALVLSHVNSRFRRIALRRTSLWSCLSSRMTKYQLDNHIERAKACPLSAVMVESRGERLEQFSNLIAEHASRWESIVVIDQKKKSASYHPDKALHALHLSNLTDFDSRVKFEEEALGEWTMPKLKSLRLLETIPQSGSSLFGSSTIERFVFSSPDECYDTEPLVKFILSLSSLTDLDLDIEAGATGEDRGECEGDILGKLPHLKRLRLKTSVPKVFSAILVQLELPVLEALDVTIRDGVDKSCDNYYAPSRWMLMLPSESCPSVKRLRLSFQNTDREPLPLLRVLTRFRGVEHLDLDIPINQPWMFESEYSRKFFKMPPLKTVAMQGPPETFLERFVQAMKQSGRWDKFEHFWLKPTAQITRTRAENVLTKQKVEWFD